MVGADPDLPKPGTAQAAIYGLGIEPTIIRLAPFVWSNGGEIVDDEEEPMRFTLDSAEAKQVVDSFFQLRTFDGVVPSDQEIEAEDDEARFANGRLAMLLGSRRSVPTFREAATFDWDVVSLPVFREPAGILHSDAYCMTKAADSKDAAWRFIEYALGPRGAPVEPIGRVLAELDEATRPLFERAEH